MQCGHVVLTPAGGPATRKQKKKKKIKLSHAGNRTRAAAVKAPNPNH